MKHELLIKTRTIRTNTIITTTTTLTTTTTTTTISTTTTYRAEQMFRQFKSDGEIERGNSMFESEKKFVDLEKKSFDFGFQVNQNFSKFVVG